MPKPPEPFDGLVSIAEYGDRTEAQVALSALLAEGFDATLSFDPTLNSVATFFASDRTYELVVRAEDAEAAVATLEHVSTGLPEEFSDDHAIDHRSSPRRKRMRRIALLMLLIWFGGPILAILIVQLVAR